MELVSLFLLLALFCMQTAAFRRSALRSSLRMTSTDVNVQQTTTTATSAIQKGKKWPGTRPPIVNLRFRQLKMDASWGRGKFREEIWEDEINPANDWWNNFAPSEEEIEAATLGYDFQNPKAYFEV